MIFSNLNLDDKTPLYMQIRDYLEDMISKGLIADKSKLPSTRELSEILNVSRNSVISTYEELKSQGLLYSLPGKGTFVNSSNLAPITPWMFDWTSIENDYMAGANEMDIVKSEVPWTSDTISFKSISPDGELFDVEELKKAFLNRISLEGHKLLNYGYAQGYKPLIDYLLQYMRDKGVDTEGKDILITNGFTEAFDLILSSFTEKGDIVICENPTHNTSIKMMKLHGLEILGADVCRGEMDFDMLKEIIESNKKIKFAYITPSYHNPTGMVMSPENRYRYYNIMKKYGIPIIEDGFNEELLYSSTHIFPIASLDNKNNGVLYIGSFSKILFPGLRIGWILADKGVVSRLESVKRCKNIHTSSLDQAILYEYLNQDSFGKYVKKIRKVYGEKFNCAYKAVEKYIPNEYILGDGGLHLFIKLPEIDARELLEECHKQNVIFMPGDLFFIDNAGYDTLRLGFSRLETEDIEKGIKIIGECANRLLLHGL
ncbi:MAG: PLP-dependent aminotransferase family protein [Clostridioides sp.]|jgi:DNA-binding transcriptional MocR family regulator|nr:PLP-dependent aminotransferase family protein [Clostridioides sp.]